MSRWLAVALFGFTSLSAASLRFASYLGGSGADSAVGAAIDFSGNVIVAGNTTSPDFPVTPAAYLKTAPGNSGFIAKFDATGSHLLFSTYFPGSLTGLALDAQGNIVVCGYTSSVSSGFVAKLSSGGNRLLFSTAIAAYPLAVAVDPQGAIYLTGAAFSGFSATNGAAQVKFGGGTFDAFAAKLSADGSHLIYATYLGGSGNEAGHAIAVDSAGNAYLAGFTASSDFPLAHAAQTKFGGPIQALNTSYGDAFVAKLDPAGAALLYATYLGGAAPDIAYGIALDAGGNAYVTGGTTSADFPTTSGAYQRKYAGPPADPASPSVGGDAFVAAFSAQGAILWSTLLGGVGYDSAAAIALDAAGNVVIAGGTDSPDFPISPDSIPSCRVASGPFVAKLDSHGAALKEATRLSGLGYDDSAGIVLDGSGAAFVAGSAGSQVFFATPAAFQSVYGGGDSDAFLAKIDLTAPSGMYPACILNAASFQAGNETFFPLGTVAPGEIVSVFGTGLGPGATAAFDGLAAPVLYSGSNQVNLVVPFGINPAGPTHLTLQVGSNSYGPVTMPVAASVPGIFTFDGSGTGHAAVLNEDGTYNTDQNPAQRGHVITFYATGAGLLSPSMVDGSTASTTIDPGLQPRPELPVSVTIRGEPATVLYAGAAPGYIAGLIQVNVIVPDNIDFGNNAPLQLTVGNNSSQLQVSVAIK